MSQPDQPHILFAGPLRRPYMEELLSRYNAHLYWKASDAEKSDIVKHHGNDIRAFVSVAGMDVDNDLIAQLPNLEVITNYGVGVDNIDVTFANKNGVKVSNTPDVLTDDTADFAFALMLASLRRVAEGDRYVRANKWGSGEKLNLGTSQRGKTMGIVGLGRIGQAIAKRAESFGMDIIYHGRSQKDVPYSYFENLVDMAMASDVLMLACPGGDETRHIINADVLNALGADGYVVNIARGSVIDEVALCAALSEGVIAGAGLDVFENEPNVPGILKTMDNVVLAPHFGSATNETRHAMAVCVMDNLKSWFENKTLLTPVTP